MSENTDELSDVLSLVRFAEEVRDEWDAQPWWRGESQVHDNPLTLLDRGRGAEFRHL